MLFVWLKHFNSTVFRLNLLNRYQCLQRIWTRIIISKLPQKKSDKCALLLVKLPSYISYWKLVIWNVCGRSHRAAWWEKGGDVNLIFNANNLTYNWRHKSSKWQTNMWSIRPISSIFTQSVTADQSVDTVVYISLISEHLPTAIVL